MGKRAISARGLLKALGRGSIGLVLVAALYVALAHAGIIRSALFPRIDGDIALAESDRPGLRVLFVGNSFTYYNSMPAMVQELATADPAAAPLFSVEYTAPNWSLREASENRGLADAIDEISWNVVVLQDVSWYRLTSAVGTRTRSPVPSSARLPRPAPARCSS